MDVTIVVPVWARESIDLIYLDECLASCAGQAQVSLWNDGSSVDILPVVDEYDDVTLGQENHHGKSYARNMAVSQAHTELIYPLDADDRLAPNAIRSLLDHWHDVPLYSYIWKWYDGDRHVLHELPTFWCGNLTKTFGVSSVNVLHSRAQWATVGGWDERYNLYEDWLYNAKLYWQFCGELVPEPLVYYRQHARQSTVYYRPDAGKVKRAIREEIEGYTGKMRGCCGGRGSGDIQTSNLRRAANPGFAAAQGRAQPVRSGRYGILNTSSLPGAESGRLVQARYVGGAGKGPHYYRPPNKSRRAYRVTNGCIVQADVEDTSTEGSQGGSLLVRIEPAPSSPPQAAPPRPAPPPPPPRRPPPRPAVQPMQLDTQPAPTDMHNTAYESLLKAHNAAVSQNLPITITERPPPPPPIPIVEDLQPLPGTVKLLKEALDSGETLEYQAHAWLREEAGKEKPRVTAIKLLERFIIGGKG